MVEEHLLGQRRALAQRQQLDDAVFLAGEMQLAALDLDRAGIEVDRQLAGADHRIGMALGAADDGLDAGDQLALVERLGQVVVGPEAQALQLVVELAEARQDEDWGIDPRGAQPAQHLVAVDVRQHEVEQDDVVIVELADLQAVLAEIGGVDDEVLRLEHQLDALGGARVVLDDQYAHSSSPAAVYPGPRPPVNDFARHVLTKIYRRFGCSATFNLRSGSGRTP